jgi:tight adherence protein C
LHEEFQRTLADLQLGITRKDAFEALGERTGSPVLKNFARAMVLADLFGVPITSVLSSQAIELRNARRARAEEEAQKIPTKITFPLVACLLPVILILLVGPSILSLIEVFGK